MNHRLDHKTLTLVGGGFFELCSVCDCWVRHDEPRSGCEGSPEGSCASMTQPPDLPLRTHLDSIRGEVSSLNAQGRFRLDAIDQRIDRLDTSLRREFNRSLGLNRMWSGLAFCAGMVAIGVIGLVLHFMHP